MPEQYSDDAMLRGRVWRVAGIGEQKAASLLAAHGTLDELLAAHGTFDGLLAVAMASASGLCAREV